jgi:hypothetical protein
MHISFVRILKVVRHPIARDTEKAYLAKKILYCSNSKLYPSEDFGINSNAQNYVEALGCIVLLPVGLQISYSLPFLFR